LPDFTEEVTIIINEEQPDLAASFHVPEDLLTERSDFFQAACRNEWKEATSRVIKLPDVETDILSLYLFWVHRGKLALRNDPDLDSDNSTDNALNVQNSLVKLWILADRLTDVRLCNTVVDEMVAGIQLCHGCMGNFTLFPPDLTVSIWSATTAGRSIRQLIIDYYITYVFASDIKKQIDEYHPDFLKELMLAALHKVDNDAHLANGEAPGDKAADNESYYHDYVGKRS
jgi:hypothetical protein